MSKIYRRSSDGAAPGDAIPFFHNGVYHLYHLSCPVDSLGSQYPYRCKASQRHVISSDLVHWEELPIALTPGPDAYDSDGCWTGSMIERRGTYHLFYTGHHVGVKNPQTICVATSDSNDGGSFTKSPNNPLIKPDPTIYEDIDFRDPYVFWNEDEQKYWMLIGACHAEGPERRRGTVALATSDDLEAWSPPQPIFSPWNTMCPECPEMFKLGDWWYLVYSHFSEDAKTTYRISKSPHGPWRVPRVPGVDGRRFYAAKSLPHGDRRIMWGTIYERIGLSNDSDWTYGGDSSVARELRSMDDGTLAVSLPAEIAASFDTKVSWPFSSKMGDWKESEEAFQTAAEQTLAYGFLQGKADGAVLFECSVILHEGYGPFGILLRPTEDLNPAFGVIFQPTRQRVVITQWPQSLDPFWAALTKAKTPNTEVDGPRVVERPVSINAGDRFKVQILVDGPIVEAFINGELAMSYRVYDTEEAALFGFLAEDVSVSFEEVHVLKES